MAKFHFNPATGKVGSCSAKKDNCPFASDDQHFSSAAEARDAFERSMEGDAAPSISRNEAWARHGNLDPDIYISVLASESNVLAERFAPDLAQDLDAGKYTVMYREDNRDKFGIVTVNGDGTFSLTNTIAPEYVSSPPSGKLRQAYNTLRENARKYNEKIVTANPGNFDPVTAGELSQEIARCLARSNWSTSVGATAGRMQLEDVEWSIDHDLALAKEQGLTPEINSLTEAKKIVSGFLDELARKS